MTILCIQHAAFEGPGIIAEWAAFRGHQLVPLHVYRGDPLPHNLRADMLLLMGGPMSVHDEAAHPWLREEKRFVAEAVRAEKRILGICLGAQVLAEVMGGTVRKNGEKEIGWFPIERTPPGSSWLSWAGIPHALTAFHWHGETFSLPPGGRHLWKSAACDLQGFACGDRVLGLQFHLEIGAAQLKELIEHCRGELVPSRWIQSEAEMLSSAPRFAEANKTMETILDAFTAGSEAGAGSGTGRGA